MEDKQFDFAIHLIGKQPYPNLMGMRDLNAKRHLLLTSNETFTIAEKLKNTVVREGVDVQIVKLSDPNDMDNIISEFTRQQDFVEKSVAVNTTGGTKPMAFAAMLGVEGKSRNVDYFYYDTQFQRRFHWPIKNSERRTESTPFSDLNVRIQLDDFIRLFDYSVNPSKEDFDLQARNRKTLTQKIWEYRQVIASVWSNNKKTLQQEAADLYDEREKVSRNGKTGVPISIYSSSCDKFGRRVDVDYEEKTGGKIFFDGSPFVISPKFGDFLGYLRGGWFEEYVYLALKDEASGRLLEVRPNVSVRSKSSPKFDMQEFDLLATDGVRLFVVECKAGNVEKKFVTKLRDLVATYAGAFGIGVLVAQKYQDENKSYPNYDKGAEIKTIFDEIKTSKNVYCFHGSKCVELLERHMPDLGTPKGQKGPIFS